MSLITFNAIKIYLQFKMRQFTERVVLTLSGLCQLLMMIGGRLLIVCCWNLC